MPPILSWVDGNLPGRTDGDVEVGDNEAIDLELEVLAVEMKVPAVGLEVPAVEDEYVVAEAEILDLKSFSFLLLRLCDGIFSTR